MHMTRNTSQCCLRNHSVANAALALPSITVNKFQEILDLLRGGVHERRKKNRLHTDGRNNALATQAHAHDTVRTEDDAIQSKQ